MILWLFHIPYIIFINKQSVVLMVDHRITNACFFFNGAGGFLKLNCDLKVTMEAP